MLKLNDHAEKIEASGNHLTTNSSNGDFISSHDLNEGVAVFVAALAELCCLAQPELREKAPHLNVGHRPPLKVQRLSDFKTNC